jgi:hypothetical protein
MVADCALWWELDDKSEQDFDEPYVRVPDQELDLKSLSLNWSYRKMVEVLTDFVKGQKEHGQTIAVETVTP